MKKPEFIAYINNVLLSAVKNSTDGRNGIKIGYKVEPIKANGAKVTFTYPLKTCDKRGIRIENIEAGSVDIYAIIGADNIKKKLLEALG